MNKFQANLCLISVTICWSTEVILLRNIPSDVPGFAVVAMTNLLGALLIALVFCRRISFKIPKKALLKLAALSVLNVGYNALLTYGLRNMDITSGAFTFSMTIVIVPIVLFSSRKHVSLQTWAGTGLIFLGIMIALGPSVFDLGMMALLAMLGACILRAIYIVLLNELAKEAEPSQVVVIMLVMVAAVSALLWVITAPETITSISYDANLLASVFIYSLFICAIANVFNIFPQKVASAEATAIIYSLEIVFTTLFAAILPDMLVERAIPTIPVVIGCALVCVGNIVSSYDFAALKERRLSREH